MHHPSRRPPRSEADDEAIRRALSTSEAGAPNCLVVGLDCRSMNLYRFLRVRFPRVPHGRLRRWIDEGQVRVNGTAVSDSRPLRNGDVVDIDADVSVTARSRRVAPPVVLYEDAALIALDKPSGLATAGERSDARPHLLGQLRAQPGREGVKLVHRIDKQASGVVVFALGRENKRALQEAFSARRVTKDYLALVSGHVEEEPELIDAPLHLQRGRHMRMVVAEGRGKPAVTLIRAVLRFRGYSIVHARPITGRTHQIRAHLRHVGHSIVGDALYGGEERLLLSFLKHGYRQSRGEVERPLLQRLALHAFRIELKSPAADAPVVVSAPLPKDLRSTLRQLQKSAGTRPAAAFEAFLADPLGQGHGAGSGADPFVDLMPEARARLMKPEPPGADGDAPGAQD